MPARVLTSRQRVAAVAAVLLGNFAPVLVAVLDQGGRHPTAFYYGAILATGAPLMAFLASSPRLRAVRVVMHYLGIPGLAMMQINTGGAASPYAVLLVMPAIWYGSSVTGWDRRVGVGLLLLACWLPMFVVGPPSYPREVGSALVLSLVLLGVITSLAFYSAEVGRLHGRLRREATQDKLTGLLNRRGWEEATAKALATAPAGPACVALIDLDGLKRANDELGHDEGDRLLQNTAERLQKAFGSAAALARLGGDEFALLLVDSTAEELQLRLTRVLDGTSSDAAFSAGVAELTVGERLGEAMRRADLALYSVKMTGRGRAGIADAPTSAQVPAELHLRAPQHAREGQAAPS